MDEPTSAGSSGKIDYTRRNRPPKRSTTPEAIPAKIDYTRRAPKARSAQPAVEPRDDAPPPQPEPPPQSEPPAKVESPPQPEPPAQVEPQPEPPAADGRAVPILPRVQAALPDAGAFLLEVLAALEAEQRAALQQELERIRHRNGWIPNANLGGIRAGDFRSGPLTLLVPIVARNPLTVGVWAGDGLPHPERQEVESAVTEIVLEQGVAAAASWAITRRPADRLDLDLLARLLQADFAHGASTIRNSQVVRAFRKWQR